MEWSKKHPEPAVVAMSFTFYTRVINVVKASIIKEKKIENSQNVGIKLCILKKTKNWFFLSYCFQYFSENFCRFQNAMVFLNIFFFVFDLKSLKQLWIEKNVKFSTVVCVDRRFRMLRPFVDNFSDDSEIKSFREFIHHFS